MFGYSEPEMLALAAKLASKKSAVEITVGKTGQGSSDTQEFEAGAARS
jgi:hypothetical protein